MIACCDQEVIPLDHSLGLSTLDTCHMLEGMNRGMIYFTYYSSSLIAHKNSPRTKCNKRGITVYNFILKAFEVNP